MIKARDEKKTAAPATEVREVSVLQTERQVCRIRFRPDGNQLFGGGYDSLIHRWDTTSNELTPLPSLSGHRGWVQSLAFLPNDQTLISVDSWGQICAWPAEDQNPQPKWKVEQAHDGWIQDLAISTDGSCLCTVGRDHRIQIRKTADGSLNKEFSQDEHALVRVTIHPDNKSVVTADLFGTLRHWDVESGQCVRELTLEKMHFYDRIQDVPGIFVLQFDETGDNLTCAGGQPTRIGNHQGIPTIHQIDWTTFEAKAMETYGASNDGFVFDLTRHPHGYVIFVTSGNPGAGQVLVTKPGADEPIFKSTKISNCHSVALHPNGKIVVVAATNRSSQGNGAVRDKNGKYLGNTSPLHVFEVVEQAEPEPA